MLYLDTLQQVGSIYLLYSELTFFLSPFVKNIASSSLLVRPQTIPRGGTSMVEYGFNSMFVVHNYTTSMGCSPLMTRSTRNGFGLY